MQKAKRYCIIGAGPSGLVSAKTLLSKNVTFDCFEREENVGGIWNFGRAGSSVYDSTYMISSKRLTEFTDFPMPHEYPPFPSHRQALAYLRSYAEHFGLLNHITFNTSVEHVRARSDGFEVSLSDSRVLRYDGLVVANGHHWDARIPSYPGRFAGDAIHSQGYKTPDQLQGRRVLVVGAGNTGCDIAVDAAQHAESVCHSMRRGYHFLPKFLFGRPLDRCGETMHWLRLPLWLRRRLAGLLTRITLGPPSRYGLPAPDHQLFETHPIVNSQLLYFVGHGRIQIKPDIEAFEGRQVRFCDGSTAEFDLVIFATGYRVSFPFLDRQLILGADDRPHLYLNAFHRQRDDLFVVGLIQPDSGLWGLADYQAQVMAAFIMAQHTDPARADWFRRLKARDHRDLARGIRYVDSPRHALEVEYFSYRRRLRRLLKKFGSSAQTVLPRRDVQRAEEPAASGHAPPGKSVVR